MIVTVCAQEMFQVCPGEIVCQLRCRICLQKSQRDFGIYVAEKLQHHRIILFQHLAQLIGHAQLLALDLLEGSEQLQEDFDAITVSIEQLTVFVLYTQQMVCVHQQEW